MCVDAQNQPPLLVCPFSIAPSYQYFPFYGVKFFVLLVGIPPPPCLGAARDISCKIRQSYAGISADIAFLPPCHWSMAGLEDLQFFFLFESNLSAWLTTKIDIKKTFL